MCGHIVHKPTCFLTNFLKENGFSSPAVSKKKLNCGEIMSSTGSHSLVNCVFSGKICKNLHVHVHYSNVHNMGGGSKNILWE